MVNTRSTVRDYGAGGSGSNAANFANRNVVTMNTFRYNDYADYLRDSESPWRALEALRASPAAATRSGRARSRTYMMMAEFPLISEASFMASSKQGLDAFVRKAAYDLYSGNPEVYAEIFDDVFQDNSMHFITLSLVQVMDAQPARNPRYRAPGRVWGYLGDKVINCVIKQMMQRVVYYLHDGEKRKFMWSPDDEPYPTDRLEDGFNGDAMRRLAQNQIYRSIKKGVETYMHGRGLKPHEDFGFEPRDLCELARLCGCRIVVWIESGGFRVCRHDTDDLVKSENVENDRRYVFNFNMMSDQHLEIHPVETITAEGYSKDWMRKNPVRNPEVVYLDNAGFEDILLREGSKSEDERRLYSIVKNVKESCKKASGFPRSAIGVKYSGMILSSGERVYKHECLEDWTRELIEDKVLPSASAVTALCLADVHCAQLKNIYRECNMYPVRQRDTPTLFNAIRWADMQFGHVQLTMEEGSKIYEYDGQKWYMGDFSDLENFPYFHGIPASNSWSEYAGTRTEIKCSDKGGFVQSVTYIGNGEGDRRFTFDRSKYAIFQVECLDLSAVSDKVKRHFERDGLFVTYDPSTETLILPSPVVHFLQDLGAIWRASRVWVCYGCIKHWIPNHPKASELRQDMLENKTYPVVMGRLMCGRNPVQSVTYLAPDPETAKSLQYFFSAQFNHGRLENEHRTDPEIIFEGEEHFYENHDDIRPDTDPDRIIFNSDGEFSGVSEATYSLVRNGGYIVPVIKEEEWGGECPFYVETFQSTYNWGSTYTHISGAQHAYAFVRLYQAAICLDPEVVVGFSLDSIKTSRDVTSQLTPFFGEGPGCLKPVQVKTYSCPVNRSGPMLSDLYTPRSVFTGINKPDADTPLWNDYKDGLKKVNFVTGKAGSGKTTRHFQLFGGSTEDYRLAKNSVYMTMTNYLAHHMQSKLGVKSFTSFKGFNRRVDDDDVVVRAGDRFNPAYYKQNDNRHNVNKLLGVHTVFLDEVSMIEPEKIRDIVEVCGLYHIQLLISGDFDRERFYQLSPVSYTQEEFFRSINEAEASSGSTFNWVEPMRVFRQLGDPQLECLLENMRNLDGRDAWDALYSSDIFRHITYRQMLHEIDPSKDIVAQPWHRIIGEVTKDVINRMQPEGELKLRGNFSMPRKITEEFDGVLSRLKTTENDSTVYKGSVGIITKKELFDLEGTSLMNNGFPYAGSSGRSNEVNPMIGATIFNLQGLTLDEDSTIYIYSNQPGFVDWVDSNQPKLAYVAATRARRRNQIVIVTGPRTLKGAKKRKQCGL